MAYYLDRYGAYYHLTGFEEKGHCFWCGIEVRGGRRYCCEEHHNLYLENFHWPEASDACRERYGGKCGDCGKSAKWASDLRAHHIIPLAGGLRLWNILNRPDNLIALCPSCHGKRHRKQMVAGQLALDLAIKRNRQQVML